MKLGKNEIGAKYWDNNYRFIKVIFDTEKDEARFDVCGWEPTDEDYMTFYRAGCSDVEGWECELLW